MRQNYEPSDITIITMYTGQLLLIKRKMPRTEFQGVKITSVDNFQGKCIEYYTDDTSLSQPQSSD